MKNKSYIMPARITLIFSKNCNLQCRHCIAKQIVSSKSVISEQELNRFYNNVANEMSTGIYNESRQMYITLYGGEPLIYFNKLKEIMEYLNNTYGNKFKFNITTNGILLNETHVDFFNQHNAIVNVSYDGYNSKYLRGFDILEEREDLLYKINNLYIYSVLSAYNYPVDAFNAILPFCTKYYELHGYHCSLILLPIKDNYNNLADYYAINQQKWSDQIKTILNSDNPIIKNYVYQQCHITGNCIKNSSNLPSRTKKDHININIPIICRQCSVGKYCCYWQYLNRNPQDNITAYCNLMRLTFGPFTK